MNIPINLTREHILKAIEKIDSEPELKTKRSSSTYDLIFEGKKYPPILVLSIANQINNGKELLLSDFNNNIEKPFNLLRENGFSIIQKKNNYDQTEQALIEYVQTFDEYEWFDEFFEILEYIISEARLQDNDQKIAFTLVKEKKRISINIGARLIFAICRTKKLNWFYVMLNATDIVEARKLSEYYTQEEEDTFKSGVEASLIPFTTGLSTASKLWILKAFSEAVNAQLPAVKSAGQPEKHNNFIYQAAVDLNYRIALKQKIDENMKANNIHKMDEQVMVYCVSSSASSNATALTNIDKKYFYWNDKTFKSLQLGDYIFVVNVVGKKMLFTKLDKIDINITSSDDKNSFFTDMKESYTVSGKYDKFIRLHIIKTIETPTEWKWKSLGSSETTYLNGVRVNTDKRENRILNIQQLKQLSDDIEYNRVLDACMLNFTNSNDRLIPEIVAAIKSDPIQNDIKEEDFSFQKASDHFNYFKNLKEPSKGFFIALQKKYWDSNSTYLEFIKTLIIESEEYKLIRTIGKLISYIDVNAANKNELNEYDDNRTLAKTGVNQTFWLKYLLKFKANNDYSTFPPTIKSALIYLEDPTKEITLFSENHREMVAINLLKQPSFNKDEFVNQFVAFFKPYGINPKNPLNYNRIISEILYHFPEVEKLWKKGKDKVKLNFTSISTDFHAKTSSAGLIFSQQLIQRFIASLCTKPFVICSGLSGSGKTKLAQAFAQWICYKEEDGEKNEQYCIVPVGADWTNREPLLGYPNALQSDKYVKPENGVLDLINRARLNEAKPYFLILDEMNLSHVERYFADFLSTMESGDAIPLHTIDDEESGIPKQIKLPKNLFIIGTVNIDETTYMFSPKVLDRANTIEFRLTEKNLEDFIDSKVTLDMDLLKGEGVIFGEGLIEMARRETDKKNLKKVETDLNDFFKELKKSGAEFGYRSASEIGRLMFMLEELGEKEDNLLDIGIMQKLLPKIHGSRNKLSKVLPVLGGFCLKNNELIKEKYLDMFVNNTLTEEILNKDSNIKYRISFQKICRMYKNAVENGFASYAEA
jgi:hypothetical protein